MFVRAASWYEMSDELSMYLVQHAWTLLGVENELGPPEWQVIDDWFEENYEAKRTSYRLIWYFHNPEKWTEFSLKWL